MSLDALTSQFAKLVGRDGIQLDGRAEELLRPRIRRLGGPGGPGGQVPHLDLLASNRRAREVNLRQRGIAAKLRFNVASSIYAARIEVAKMVDVRWLALGGD